MVKFGIFLPIDFGRQLFLYLLLLPQWSHTLILILAAKVDDEIFYQDMVQWIWHVCPICIALPNMKQHYLSSLLTCAELVENFSWIHKSWICKCADIYVACMPKEKKQTAYSCIYYIIVRWWLNTLVTNIHG